MDLLAVPTLAGRLVRLEPLRAEHGPDLVSAVGDDRSTYGYTAVPVGRKGVDQYIATMQKRCQAGEILPFAQVRVADGRAVGSTSYLNVRREKGRQTPFAVEIGHTWLGAAAQRTGINTEAKLLLLTFAFETWHAARVDLKTDARNERSRAAIGRIGGRFEGVLRNWQPSHVAGEEGGFRHTAMFSVISEEWPSVKARVSDLLEPTARPSIGRGPGG